MSRLAAGILLAALTVTGVGCLDVRDFEGEWQGAVISEEAIRQGFATGTTVAPLTLKGVDLNRVSATLTTSDGKFNKTALTRVAKFSNDTLSSLVFEGNDVRSYMFNARLDSETSGCPATVLISLFSDDHVEARVIRANDLFGVFHLTRKE